MDFKDLLYRAKEGSRDAQEELTPALPSAAGQGGHCRRHL